MIRQHEIDQLEQSTGQELERLFAARKKYKNASHVDAVDFVSHVESSIKFLVHRTCSEEWMAQWATTHPVSAIIFLNSIYQELEEDQFSQSLNKTIQTSNAFKILKAKYPQKCRQFLSIDQLTEPHLRALAVLELINSQKDHAEKEPLFLGAQFRTAVGDFQTIPQLWDVRDEARRRLVSQALIACDFKTRAAALSIGCKSDGAMAGNVRVLFGGSDYKRATIEPLIRAWEPQRGHPFQSVIDALVELKTLPKVEAQIEEFYPALLMRAAEKCQFVKVRMANSLDISEKTVNSMLASLSLEAWYVDAHREFLHRACEAVGYNYSQVATLLNVDVRYITQHVTTYGIEKPESGVRLPAVWPT